MENYDKIIKWYSNPSNIEFLGGFLRRKIYNTDLFKDPDDVEMTIEDVIQTTYLRLFKTYKNGFIKIANIDTLIFTVAINNLLSEIRRRNRWRSISIEGCERKEDEGNLPYNINFEIMKNVKKGFHLPKVLSPEDYAENIELKEILEKEINKLEYKEALLLDAEGYSYKEIAKELNIPLGTVKSRIYRARKRLRRTKALKNYTRD